MTRGIGSAARSTLRRRGLWLAFPALAALFVVGYQPVAAFGVLEALFPRVVWRVESAQPLVGLSFDDGPSPDNTAAVLDILARHQARATFFLIGTRAAAHPELVRRIREEGHEVGSHYISTGSALWDSRATFAEKLLRTEQILQLPAGRRLFRPPGGLIRPSQLAELESRGYLCVLGSAYPYDPRRPPAGYMTWLVAKNLRPGAIVILHDGIADPSRTIAALDGILEAGRRKGLRFVSVGELLAVTSRSPGSAAARAARRSSPWCPRCRA